MRRVLLRVPAAFVLAGPTVLAFLAGGYFTGPRVWAGALSFASVIVCLGLGARLPRTGAAWLAIGGLGALSALSLGSIAWAAVAGDALGAAQIAVLYTGALLAAVLALRDPLARRCAEPALALGCLVVIGEGLAGRLLPGVVHLQSFVSAQGRLDQPLTYWNAMGELAALGLVLCARLAGDATRPVSVRALAAGAGAPLGLAVYDSFSRGALFAVVAGLITLAALLPRRRELAGLALTALAGLITAGVVSPLHGVTGLEGSLSHREGQGLVAFAVVVVVGGLAAVGQLLTTSRVSDRAVALGPLRHARARGWTAAGVICVGLALAIVVGAGQTGPSGATLSGGAGRLVSLRSDRYDYWRVALRAFAHRPLYGIGAGNWQVDWLRWRPISEFATDAHSLPLQTLAELGVLGGLALLAFVAGVALAGARAMRRPGGAAVAAGPIAVLVTYAAHAPLDWDWQMPAVTLVATALAGLLIALAQP